MTYWTVSFYDEHDKLLGALTVAAPSATKAIIHADFLGFEEGLIDIKGNDEDAVAVVARIECRKGVGK